MDTDPNSLFDKVLCDGLADWDMCLSRFASNALLAHYRRVVEVNRRFNLTRITAPADFAIKHHLDSLAVAKWAHENGVKIARVLDIGTGAGSPAVPLAVANPDWQVTAIDGTGKKAAFVAQIADELALTNLRSVHARAESWHSEKPFDLAVLKAIGSIERCLSLARAHLSPGGRVVVFKTANPPAAEVVRGAAAAERMGFVEAGVYAYELSLEGGTLARTLRVYRLARRKPTGLSRRRRRRSG